MASQIPEMRLNFGDICWLMSRSKDHRHISMGDMDRLVIPPLSLQQVRMFRDNNGGPMAFVSWAFVSDEVDQRLKYGSELQPAEWKSGQHFWIIDVVVPFGGIRQILEIIQKALPPNRPHPMLPFGGRDLTSVVEELVKADGDSSLGQWSSTEKLRMN